MYKDSDDDGFAVVHIAKSKSTSQEEAKKTVKASPFPAGGSTSASAPTEDALPGGEDGDEPSLDKARKFYSDQLPKRVVDPQQPSGYRMALPGEVRDVHGEPATYYRPFFGSAEQIFEFGSGVALYFKTLKMMFTMFVIFAACTVLSMDANKTSNPTDIAPALVGTAVGATPTSLKISGQGVANLIVSCTLLLFALFAGKIQKMLIEKIDDNLLTPADFTVVVENPPHNVSNPEEYRAFFGKFGDVVLVTVALNNGELIESMVQDKLYATKVEQQAKYKERAAAKKQYYADQDTMSPLQTLMQRTIGIPETLGFVTDASAAARKQLRALVMKDYRPWRVYVTFATQEAARSCLLQTSLSYFSLISGAAPGSQANFQGCLLNVSQAPEPTDIIYENSHVVKAIRWAYTCVSYAICAGLLTLVFVGVTAMSKSGHSAVGIYISCVNAMLPTIVLLLSNFIEVHIKKSDLEMSTLVKLVLVRCINSGVLIYLAVDEEDRFSSAHLSSIQSILIADAVTTPLFRFLDIPGFLNRNIAAKMVITQEEMNLLWSPTEWTMAERYTDMLKTIFVGCFFAVPVPSGLIITACAMFSIYCVDKYSLMRLWRRPPTLDDSLSTAAQFFFWLIVLAHMAASRNYFAMWPYGQRPAAAPYCSFFLCETKGDMSSDQSTLVKAYNVLTLVVISLVALQYLLYRTTKWFIGLFSEFSGVSHTARKDVTGDHDFRKLHAVSAYVPVMEPAGLADPIVFSNIDNLPAQYVPLQKHDMFNENIDPTLYSAVKMECLPADSCSDEGMLRSLFSQVSYFEVKGADFVPYVRPAFLEAGTAGATTVASSSSAPAPRSQQAPAPVPASAPAPAPVPASTSSYTPAAPLPAGWHERTTKDGKTYYANSETKTTQWTRPTA